MATIGDVAKAAGVSRSTVSYVLSGKRAISPATKARVTAAIAQLGFEVNSGARALATARTMNIGLVVQLHHEDFRLALAPFLVGLSDAAEGRGYSMLLVTESDGPGAIRRIAAARRVDAFVVLNIVESDPRIAPLAESGLPSVLVGMPSDTGGLDAIDLDFALGARRLVELVARNGHREVFLVDWPQEVYDRGFTYAIRFRAACEAAAAAAGVSLEVAYCDDDAARVRPSLARIVSRIPAGSGVIVHNDAAIAALPDVTRELGREVPRDLSVASLHSSELTRLFALPYTCVLSRPEHVTALAVDMAVRRLQETPDAPAVHVLVPPVLDDRGSVAPR